MHPGGCSAAGRFPGAGQAGQLGDLNAEKAYSAMAVHMQTVAGNEALVQYLNTKCGAGNGEARPVEAFGCVHSAMLQGVPFMAAKLQQQRCRSSTLMLQAHHWQRAAASLSTLRC